MNTLTIPQQLEALQAVADNPDISRDDILLHAWTTSSHPAHHAA